MLQQINFLVMNAEQMTRNCLASFNSLGYKVFAPNMFGPDNSFLMQAKDYRANPSRAADS